MLNLVQIKNITTKALPNLPLSEEIIKELQCFNSLLAHWNKSINLTSIRDPKELFYKHILDSLVPLEKKIFPDQGKIVDLGSGAGIPGGVISIVNKNLNITSIDKVEKKIIFQKVIKDKINLTNFHPTHERLSDKEVLEPEKQFDVLVTRAFSSLNSILKFARCILKKNSKIVLWKGGNWERELKEVDGDFKESFSILEKIRYEFDEFNIGGQIVVLNFS